MAGVINLSDPLGPVHILSVGRYSALSDLASFDAQVSGSAVWPTNNLGIYIPITIPHRFTVARFFWYNGSNITGNCDAGLFNSAGTKLISTGSTARANTNTVQFANVVDYVGDPGRYFLGLSAASTTGAFQRIAMATVGALRASGVVQEASALALPATMTPASAAQAYVPLFGFTQDDTY